MIKSQLKHIKLTPSIINIFISQIITQISNSHIKPNTIIKLITTNTQNNIYTQKKLNTIHKTKTINTHNTQKTIKKINNLLNKQQHKIKSKYNKYIIFFKKPPQTLTSLLHHKHPTLTTIILNSLLQTNKHYKIKYTTKIFPNKKLPT